MSVRKVCADDLDRMLSRCFTDLDVMYLTYPMNFNVTPEVTRNDAETFIPITCQENAGMTGPIHAIVWLMLNETLKAETEFNRSMQACTYGAFHVRNEVRLCASFSEVTLKRSSVYLG